MPNVNAADHVLGLRPAGRRMLVPRLPNHETRRYRVPAYPKRLDRIGIQ